MPFGDFAPGAYSLYYDENHVGLLEGQPRMVERMAGEPYKGHLFGMNTIDIVYTGVDSLFLLFTLKEWNAVTKSILFPWGATIGTYGIPFRLATSLAKTVQLVAAPGSPAATLGPVTRTFELGILAPNSNLETPMGGSARDVPIVLQMLPNPESVGSHSAKYFTDT